MGRGQTLFNYAKTLFSNKDEIPVSSINIVFGVLHTNEESEVFSNCASYFLFGFISSSFSSYYSYMFFWDFCQKSDLGRNFNQLIVNEVFNFDISFWNS